MIPLLRAKANIALQDARGKITVHRARATIASALYNAPEGLGISELGQWLCHKDIRSTQYYAKLHPTRLAESIARANKNSWLIQVLMDPTAAAKGEPAISRVRNARCTFQRQRHSWSKPAMGFFNSSSGKHTDSPQRAFMEKFKLCVMMLLRGGAAW